MGSIIFSLIALIFGAGGGGVGSQNPQSPSVIFQDTTDTTTAKSLQLKTLAVVTTTPPPAPLSSSIVDCNVQPPSDIKWEPRQQRAFSPAILGPNDTLHIWYADENSVMLGVNAPGFPVTTMTPGKGADHAINPQIGDPTALDPSGRPIYPSLYLTDITGNPANREGDFENGGTPIPLHSIWGVWNDTSRTSNGYAKLVKEQVGGKNINNGVWNLDGGTQPPPLNKYDEDDYGAEIRWEINRLTYKGQPLQSGHQYRAQFITHDGDQTKGGGDLGVGCATIQIP